MEIYEKLYENLKERFEQQKQIPSGNGGELRQFSGETVELFVNLTCKLVSEEKGVEIVCKKGPEDPIKIYSPDGKYFIEESVDRHIYINGTFVSAVECKTYLDKCYLQRADSDFYFMKQKEKKLNTGILSLEDSVDEMSLSFFLQRGNVNNVWFLFDGKRNSSPKKRIYKTYEARKNYESIKTWVRYIEGLADEYKKTIKQSN